MINEDERSSSSQDSPSVIEENVDVMKSDSKTKDELD